MGLGAVTAASWEWRGWWLEGAVGDWRPDLVNESNEHTIGAKEITGRKNVSFKQQNPGAFLGTTKETKTPLLGTFWTRVLSSLRWLKVA